MSDQSALSDGRENDFGLIETLLWTRGEGLHLFAEHFARLAASSAALGFSYEEARIRKALSAAVAQAASDRLRVRLVLMRDGEIETSVAPVESIPGDAVWRVALAERRFSSNDPLLRHKTTRRALYEDSLAEAAQRCGADEILFLNERGELCEAARCNLFVPQGEILLTPPLASGLLPGTLRAALIAQGRARESILRIADISGSEFFLGNSVRGLIRARLIG